MHLKKPGLLDNFTSPEPQYQIITFCKTVIYSARFMVHLCQFITPVFHIECFFYVLKILYYHINVSVPALINSISEYISENTVFIYCNIFLKQPFSLIKAFVLKAYHYKGIEILSDLMLLVNNIVQFFCPIIFATFSVDISYKLKLGNVLYPSHLKLFCYLKCFLKLLLFNHTP